MSPKRWRLNRQQRLRAGSAFIAGYTGKDIVRGYVRHFHVDRLCALTELPCLGVSIPNLSERIAHEKAVIEGKGIAKIERKRKELAALEPVRVYGLHWDETYAYIAGFTSGGPPYGTTWEEIAALKEGEASRGIAEGEVVCLEDEGTEDDGGEYLGWHWRHRPSAYTDYDPFL